MELIILGVVILFIGGVFSVKMWSNHTFCSKHFPEEVAACMFSSKYRYDGD